MIPYGPGQGPKRRYRVTAALNQDERRKLAKVRRYVHSMTGYGSTAEALRYLIRDWETR